MSLTKLASVYVEDKEVDGSDPPTSNLYLKKTRLIIKGFFSQRKRKLLKDSKVNVQEDFFELRP